MRQNWMLLHGIPAAIALLIAPFQFSNRLRQRYLQLHRVMGRIYILCVAIGASTAVVVALKIGMPVLRKASVVQASGWLLTTATALYCIRTRRIKQDREWMFRSYPFATVFVVVRVINAIPALTLLGAEARPSVVWTVIATACFLPSFVLAWQAIAAEKTSAKSWRTDASRGQLSALIPLAARARHGNVRPSRVLPSQVSGKPPSHLLINSRDGRLWFTYEITRPLEERPRNTTLRSSKLAEYK